MSEWNADMVTEFFNDLVSLTPEKQAYVNSLISGGDVLMDVIAQVVYAWGLERKALEEIEPEEELAL